MAFSRTTIGAWIVFYTYWLVSAIGVKKPVDQKPSWPSVVKRVVLVWAAVSLVALFQRYSLGRVRLFEHIADLPGLLICVSGMALAVWARVHLGRNWGMPMSLKEGHELATRGPYAFLRHPIYTGILLAILGSGFVLGLPWFITFVIFCPYFLHSARTEERLMLQQFPSEYPDYMRKTKALVPFLWFL